MINNSQYMKIIQYLSILGGGGLEPPCPPGSYAYCEGFLVLGTRFHYKTIDRDCTSVPSGDSSYSKGCHDTSENPGLIVQTYQDLGLSGITFSGQSCYSGSDWKTFAYAQVQTGGATIIKQPMILITMCFSINIYWYKTLFHFI